MIYEIIRCQAKHGNFDYTAQQPDSSASLLDGNLSAGLQSNGGIADVAKLLAPLVPKSLLCIDLDYRKRVEETGTNHPDSPLMLFEASPYS